MTVTLNDKISKAAQKDIIELEEKIERFNNLEIDEERFKLFRLTRGVYGQRQAGVQMFRTKLPYGKLTTDQLRRIADISDEYTNGNLHTTTRQNIQLHYIKLEDTPEIWVKLEEVGVTAREACGNTVRNITASPYAGIDPNEPFDVTPYAEAVFQYFLRNPICQEMGRKIKMAFSSNEKDAAFTYIHDFGFIPRIKDNQRGFKVVIGGGLGAQPFMAQTAFEFLPEDQVIPFIEAGLRVFDRHGERANRNKARMKYLIEPKRGLGIEKFLELVNEERKALPYHSYPVDHNLVPQATAPVIDQVEKVEVTDRAKYEKWLETNVFEQEQKGAYAVQIKLLLGNISSDNAQVLADLVDKYAANDIRITINQGLLLKYVPEAALPILFNQLNEIGLAEPGFGSIADITACPGTDTCNLAVSNSTAISVELEKVINQEFPQLINDTHLGIKISGCMNSCGQHMIANIGFHGSSIKNGNLVIPAMQVVMGGGVAPDGRSFIAEKVIKLPSKRIPNALREILTAYENESEENEYFNDFFLRKGGRYFYGILKHLADKSEVHADEYVDWGSTESFVPEIGTGECAGVVLDVIGTIIKDADDKQTLAKQTLDEGAYSAAIYYSYSVFVVAAKALLLSQDIACNTHNKIINDFQKTFVESGDFSVIQNFEELVLQINKNEATQEFAKTYLQQSEYFLEKVKAYRNAQVAKDSVQEEKLVVKDFYKA
ncbi:MAG: nitrite reductase [Bacteroidota bacterium]